jgi:hypothetical protein
VWSQSTFVSCPIAGTCQLRFFSPILLRRVCLYTDIFPLSVSVLPASHPLAPYTFRSMRLSLCL